MTFDDKDMQIERLKTLLVEKQREIDSLKLTTIQQSAVIGKLDKQNKTYRDLRKLLKDLLK